MMSSLNNYMDNVPVKISEKYKPPPRIYQPPQSIVNKLNLPDGHYYENPQFAYDFQLERKVLAKIPEYKRKREMEREARQERREKREKEQQRRIEEQHKKMLGAVSYPNAEELSSSDSADNNDDDDDDNNSEQMKKKDAMKKDANWLGSHSFNNILQPTVLTHNGADISENSITDNTLIQKAYNALRQETPTGAPIVSNSNNKLANTFNYKDFEEDTSSPFDNIELKTINDLDILRQVLHNTQIKANKEKAEDELKDSRSKSDELNSLDNNTKEKNVNDDISTFEKTKAALEKVNFSDINIGLEQQQHERHQPLQFDNIPAHNCKSSYGNYFNPSLSATMTTPTTIGTALLPNNMYNIQHNYQQNYFYTPNCNSNISTIADHQSVAAAPTTMYYLSKNAHNLHTQFNNFASDTKILKQKQQYTQDDDNDDDDDVQSTKSRSVPDLFQELRDEVRNSEMRRKRLRNYSHNFDGSKELKDEEENENEKKCEDNREIFNKLPTSVKALAKNISSMGFPLSRVAKIAEIYGEDDKKIVEHLIPLTELLDLGFDEAEITAALLKYDNNKEKALEHLIT